MRTAPMCYTVFRVPRCNVYAWVNTWRNVFGSLNRECKGGYNFRLLSSSVCEQGGNKRWSRRPISTNSEGRSKDVLSSAGDIRHGITDEMVTSITTNINIKKADDSKLEQIQCIDFQKLVAENKDFAELATFIIFDIETSGFIKFGNIIEIALLDIHGGENSTFQALVNPGHEVPNSCVHGITTQMVRKPGVPRNLNVSKSKCLPIGILDTLALGRERVKSRGEKVKGSMSLQALREHYRIELEGSAHRVMSDVLALTQVLQKLSFDMKLTRADLIQRSFTVNELNSGAKEIKGASKKS